MFRSFAALAVALLLAGAASAADAGKTQVLIRWHGQSFFEIHSSKGTRIVTDPHAIDTYPRISVEADLVTISHFHNDHTHVEVVENADKAKILTGLKVDGKKVEWNAIDEKVKDVHVRTVGVYHDTKKGMERGKNGVFVFEVDGLHIVHLGDLGHLLSDEEIKAIGPVDVLMIPVGGIYTVNGAEAKKVVEKLKPRQYILPMHFGTKVFDLVLPVDEFLEDQKKENVKKLDTNELIVKPDFKPAEPVIVVLGWENKK
jgi:L-ascorbate metabolism protein UlaG (beta-lactamase superfamily)